MSRASVIPASPGARRRAAARCRPGPRSPAAARAGARASRPAGASRRRPGSRAQSPRSAAFQCCSRLLTSAGLRWQYACSRAYVDMYSRNRSSGSCPTRSARRLAAALISPELVSASTRAAIARVHLARLDDLVDQQIGVGLAGRPFAAGDDRLAGGAIADRARQAEVGGAGDDPLLAGGQVQARAAHGDHVVDDVQQLARAADRVVLDRGHPQLLDSARGRDQAAVELVDVAEVAHQIEEEVDPALVEMGEVDARARRSARPRSGDDRRPRRGTRRPRISGSSRIRSTADSVGPSVSPSSALRWRGLRSSSTAGPPLAGDARRAEVDEPGPARNCRRARARRASARASTRPGGGPPRAGASTCATSRPWASSNPACRPAAAHARPPSRRGSGPGRALAGAA